MAYQHIPDHLKKPGGRPRKYHNGYCETPVTSYYEPVPDELKKKKGRPKNGENYIPKRPPIKNKGSRNSVGGYTVVMLDYYTMEYIETYNSLKAFEEDNNIPRGYLGAEFKRVSNGIAILPEFEVMAMKLKTYRLIEGGLQA